MDFQGEAFKIGHNSTSSTEMGGSSVGRSVKEKYHFAIELFTIQNARMKDTA